MKLLLLMLLLIAFPIDAQVKTQFVEVEPNVKLETVDWGGSGRPIVLISGLGGVAHDYDSFATDLKKNFHVYGVTRRGYGASSIPTPTATNYNAQRLGDDVIAVMNALHLDRPILIGHSFGGEELSSVGSRFPERVAGLVYLDAANRYAFSGPGLEDFQIDLITMRERITTAMEGISPAERKAAIDQILSEWASVEKDLQTASTVLTGASMGPDAYAKAKAESKTPEGLVEQAMMQGEQRFARIPCPILAIYPSPHALPGNIIGEARSVAEKRDVVFVASLASRVRAQPNATVLLIPHAEHSVQNSNRAEVLAAIGAFAAKLN
jgi:non-heme chloroperoxidase